MNASLRLSAGRADPFGLLVLAVVLALVVTIGIQSAVADNPGPDGGSVACRTSACVSADSGK